MILSIGGFVRARSVLGDSVVRFRTSVVLSGIWLGLAAGGAASGPAMGAEGDPEAGRQIAERRCARCHVVGTAKPYAGIDSSPTFFLMNEKLDNYRQRILSFKERRPHKALDFTDVSRDDLDDLLAYIAGLSRPE